MSVPDSPLALVALVVLIVPGLVYSVVRRALKGFTADDKSIDTRIAQALLFSIVLDALYLVLVYPKLFAFVRVTDKTIDIVDPVALGGSILIGAVLVPGLIALVINGPWRLRRRPKTEGFPLLIERRTRYSSVPTAWDYAAVLATPRFIRILLPDGRFVGGWWGPESYVSTYPEPRDIFISFPYKMSAEGKFIERTADSDGLWLTVPDGALVEWVNAPETSGN